MESIVIRENRHGKYWCSVTHNCYDHYTESDTIEQAKKDFTDLAQRIGIKHFSFGEIKHYQHDDPLPKPPITYKINRIDYL